jgi:imidazolonepropionase
LQLNPENTRNAAKALGIESKVTTLAIGMQADCCLRDIDSPAQLAYGATPCKQVVKKGILVHQEH